MSRKTTYLLVVSLVGVVVADQTQEVYNKDDSTYIQGAAPKFRDASDFTTPSSDSLYVSIDGLPSNQHGFKLVNPQYLAQQSSKKVMASQKEDIRKRDEFVKSFLEANSASIDAQKYDSNIFRPSQPLPSSLFEKGAFKSDASDNTRFGTLDLFGTGVPEDSAFLTADTGETTTHSVFDFHFPQEHKGTSSQKEFPPNGRDIIGGTSPKPVQRNDFNGFQSDISSTNNNGGRKQSFVFRERGTTPPFQQVVDSGSTVQDFGRFGQTSFSSERPTFTRFNANQNRKPGVLKSDRNAPSRLNPATLTPRPSLVEPSLDYEFPIADGEEKFGTRQQPGFVQLQSPVVPGPSRFAFRGQGSDDEESKFISQLNQKTASFVSTNDHVNGFKESVPVSFEAIQSAPRKTTDLRMFSQDFPAAAQSTENKRRKESGQRLRRPFQNTGSSDDGPTLPPIPVNRFSPSNKFQNANAGESEEEVIDQEVEARKQAEGAKYSFASAVMDTVNDNSQIRQEVRDGLKLKGMYSYSDGYFKRTVYYEADEGGFRVVKEENEPIGTGPQFNPNGEVHVNYQQAGSNLQYKIRGNQLRKATKKGQRVETSHRFDDYNDQLELPN